MSAVGQRLKRFVVVLLVVCVAIGVVPQSRAQAFLGPPVVAPPVTGLCVTPVSVILCMAAGVVVSGGLIWAADRIAGLTPQEDGTWDWCEYDGVVAAIKCLGDDAAPPLVTGDWTDLVPELEYPEGGSGNYRNLVWDEINYLVPRYGEGHLNMAILGGIDVKGATVEPIWDGETVIGQRFTVYAEPTGLGDPPDGCPWGELVSGAIAAWAFCTGLQGKTGGDGMAGRVTTVSSGFCSSGTATAGEQIYSGWGIIEEVYCLGGEWNMGASSSTYWVGSGTPDPANNRHQYIVTCHKLNDGAWRHYGYGASSNNCEGVGTSHDQYSLWLTKAEPEMVQSVAIAECRGVDGTSTTRISSGEPTAGFMPEVAPAPSPCLPGEIPMETTISICPTEAELSECREVGTIAIPTIPPEVDMECLYRLASDNPCSMWVEKWNGTEWEECVPDDNCVGWWSQPNRDTHYRCGWGGTYLIASQCVPLKDFYEAEEDQAVPVLNPGGDPNPDPTAGGDPVQIGGPVPPVSAQPTKRWYERVIQEWSTGTIPNMNNACWPQGWGLLNPLQWVLRPIMCALAWAFVPTGVTLEQLAAESLERLHESPTFTAVTTLVTMPGDFLTAFGAAAGSASCGLVASIPLAPDFTVDLVIIPCAEPHFVEAAGIVKPILSASIMAGALMGGIRVAVGAHFKEED